MQSKKINLVNSKNQKSPQKLVKPFSDPISVQKRSQEFSEALNRGVLKSMTKDEYYTIEEVAKMLKVAYLTVYRWIQAGKLMAYKAGKQYRIKKEDLTVFMKEKK